MICLLILYILSSLTITVEEQSTWEIDDKLQFPHFIKCSFVNLDILEIMCHTTGKHYDLNPDPNKEVSSLENRSGLDAVLNLIS